MLEIRCLLQTNRDAKPSNKINGIPELFASEIMAPWKAKGRQPQAHQVQYKQQPYWRREAPPRPNRRWGLWLLVMLDLVGLWVPRRALEVLSPSLWPRRPTRSNI